MRLTKLLSLLALCLTLCSATASSQELKPGSVNRDRAEGIEWSR